MDAKTFLNEETFPLADCAVLTNGNLVPYSIVGGQINVVQNAVVDLSNLTDVFELFAINTGDATYGGGEAAAHGSCGYFYKMRDGKLIWAVMSLDSNPFSSAKVDKLSVTFFSTDGQQWTIINDDVESLRVSCRK